MLENLKENSSADSGFSTSQVEGLGSSGAVGGFEGSAVLELRGDLVLISAL